MPDSSPKRAIPEATVARLPIYLRALQEVSERDEQVISSVKLADMAGVNAAKVRKDFSYFGSYGVRGVGYDVDFLLFQIRRELGLTHDWPCIIAGMGNLGQALAKYGGFSDRGFVIRALIDSDPVKIGTSIGGVEVCSLDRTAELVDAHDITIGVIATPGHAAQEVADAFVAAGVGSILNFAPTVISVPDHVSVRKVDLAVELQILSFYQEHDSEEPAR